MLLMVEIKQYHMSKPQQITHSAFMAYSSVIQNVYVLQALKSSNCILAYSFYQKLQVKIYTNYM